MSVSFPALGTTATLVVTEPSALLFARAELDGELSAIDAACNRFRVDSELSRVNRLAGRPVAVGPVLLEALLVAIAAARSTDGLVDPTVGRSLRLAGYDATFRVVATRDGTRFRARYERPPGWAEIEIDAARATVRIPEGVELDLGATAKALATDRAARAAAESARCGVLVGLGGDIAVAGTPPEGGWPIGIADDHATRFEPAQTIAITSGGVATSSTTVRRWRSEHGDVHHIIDPRTGRSAMTPWRTCSVAAATCVDANVASTASLVLGAGAPAWLGERRLPARLVSTNGDVTVVGGWPAGGAGATTGTAA